jgi:hypothetical protein
MTPPRARHAIRRGSFTILPRKGGGYELVIDDGYEIVSRMVDRELGEEILTAVQVAAFKVLGRRI